MQLLAAWQASLTVLLPKNFGLVMGAVWLAMIRTYRVLWSHWWWLILGLGVIHLLYGPVAIVFFHEWSLFTLPSLVGFPFIVIMYDPEFTNDTIMRLMCASLYTGLLFSVYASARPSASLKNRDYFVRYIRHFMVFIGWFLCVRLLIFVLLCIPAMFLIVEELSLHWWYGLWPIMWYMAMLLLWLGMIMLTALCVGLMTFWVFFFLDTPGAIKDSIRSIGRAFMMALRSLPLVAVLFMMDALVMWLLTCVARGVYFFIAVYELSYLTPALAGILYLCALPCSVVLFSVVYARQLYSNSATYLG